MVDIDPIQVLIANQNQLKLLVNSIYKYVPMGASQAIMLDQIITYFNEKTIEDQVSTRVIEKVGVISTKG